MAAIITEQFRINSRKRLMQDIADTENNSYYIGIGKEDDWTEKLSTINPTSPFPAGTPGDAAQVRNNISSLFKIASANVSTMLPKHVIQSNRSYKVYNPYDPTCFYASADEFPCFVISRLDNGGEGDQVYLCIGKSHDATTASTSFQKLGLPDSEDGINGPGIYSSPLIGGDGYRWLYMGKYIAGRTELNNGSFVAYDYNQNVLNNSPIASPGLIHGFHIINSGNGLEDATDIDLDITITGERANINSSLTTTASVNIVNGSIVKITINPDITFGNNYKLWEKATAQITTAGYESVKIVPIVSPINGYENNIETTLPSWYIGVSSDTIAAQYIPAGTTYRQISILKNPKTNNNDLITGASIDKPHKSFSSATELAIGSSEVGIGWKLRQGDNGEWAVGTISFVEQIGGVYHYYYYNSIEGGLLDISAGQDLIIIAPDSLDINPDNLIVLSGNYTLSDDTNKYDRSTGEVLFIDNRGAVTREQGQNEEIKIIIQL